MVGPSTINGELVFLPTMTGEIYVHSLTDGAYIRTIYCPQYEWQYEVDGETLFAPNREGSRSGQTMVDDYLRFYCGATYNHPSDKTTNDNALLQRGSLMVWQLNATYLTHTPTTQPTFGPTSEPTLEPTEAKGGDGGDGDGLTEGEIIGLAIGLFFVVLFIAAGVMWFLHRNADNKAQYGAVPADTA